MAKARAKRIKGLSAQKDTTDESLRAEHQIDLPYLAAAFLCEKVLVEKDEVNSIIRIVDTLWVVVPKELPADARPVVNATAFLSFRKHSSSEVPEKHSFSISLAGPGGKILKPSDYQGEIMFPPGEIASANIVVSLGLHAREFGLYWLEIKIEDQLVTRVPFRMLQKSEPTPSSLQ